MFSNNILIGIFIFPGKGKHNLVVFIHMMNYLLTKFFHRTATIQSPALSESSFPKTPKLHGKLLLNFTTNSTDWLRFVHIYLSPGNHIHYNSAPFSRKYFGFL